MSVASFFLLPTWETEFGFGRKVAAMPWGERSAVLAGAAFAIGFLLNSWQSILYRVLEGYLLPRRLRERRTASHLKHKTAIKVRYDHARDVENDQYRMNIELERFRKFPPDEEIMPTALGNAIRTAEVYGWERYRLDVVTLWYHLQSVLDENLRADEDRARSAIDFQICAAYLSAIFAILCGITITFAAYSDSSVILLGVLIVLVFLFYRGAVVAAHEWRKTIEAVVDLGRRPLASSLDLTLPASVESEREMWRVVGQIVKYPYTQKRSMDLGPFRR